MFAELAAERDANAAWLVNEERLELAGVEKAESAVLRDLREGLRLNTLIKSRCRMECEEEEEGRREEEGEGERSYESSVEVFSRV